MAVIALFILGLCAWLAPRIYRSLRAEKTALAAILRKWAGEVRTPQLTSFEERRLAVHSCNLAQRRLYSVIATADVKGLRSAVGTLCVTGREAVFFSRRWRRPVERQIGPLIAIEARKGFLVDELVLAAVDGRRIRFDLLVGQMDNAREAAVDCPSPSSHL
jgi:hypothetical protein